MRSSRISAAILASALAAAALPACAQEQPTAEQAMAGVIHAALAPSSYGDWRYGWDAVSIRISSKMHWHLPGPDKPDAETTRRTGWIAAGGQQIGVSAWGPGEAVSGLSFEVKSWRLGADEPGGLLAALAAQGVTATEIERRDPPSFFHTDVPIIVYRLAAAERDERNLTRSMICTSPMSAAAARCAVSYTLDLGG